MFIGARFLLVSRPVAAGHGVPAKKDGDAAYLTIKGLRDGGYGLLGLALLASAGAHAMLCRSGVPNGRRSGVPAFPWPAIR